MAKNDIDEKSTIQGLFMLYKAAKETVPDLIEGHVPFFQKRKRFSLRLFIFFVLALQLLIITLPVNAETSPKFLIIHLDAVCSEDFYQYMDDGYLPNVKEIFESGHMIRYGLSLFPGGTETIYPRMKKGIDNAAGESVGWGHYDRDSKTMIPKFRIFSHLFSQVPRRARASFVYGVPFLDIFNFLPMSNIPELLETYKVIELLWFATDAIGHHLNRDYHLDSIRRFDRYFGHLVRQLDIEEVNFILYCDHGMCFDNPIIIEQDYDIREIVGDDFSAFIFPNLYLERPELSHIYARRIVMESEIDFAFYRGESGRVEGYSRSGKIIFEEQEDRFRYCFEGEDSFGYYEDGYQGEWLTDLEWLSVTRDSEFPAVPPNIYRIFVHQHVGDIAIAVNSPKIAVFPPLPFSGHHHGITKNDLLVPILLRGKELEHLYDREEMWLHTLFASVPALDFDEIEPEREKNTFSFWGSVEEGQYPDFELSLSPAYRWNVALHYEQETYKGWFEYDVYSSYVIRLWAGAGLQHQEKSFDPFLHARLQMDFGKIQLNYGGQVNLSNLKDWQENRKEIIYQINDRLSFNWMIPNRFGFSLHW